MTEHYMVAFHLSAQGYLPFAIVKIFHCAYHHIVVACTAAHTTTTLLSPALFSLYCTCAAARAHGARAQNISLSCCSTMRMLVFLSHHITYQKFSPTQATHCILTCLHRACTASLPFLPATLPPFCHTAISLFTAWFYYAAARCQRQPSFTHAPVSLLPVHFRARMRHILSCFGSTPRSMARATSAHIPALPAASPCLQRIHSRARACARAYRCSRVCAPS